MKVRLLKILSFLLMLSVLIYVLHPYWLPLTFNYLDVSGEPQHADMIVILGGDNFRPAYALELYEVGYAPFILLSGHHDTMQTPLAIISVAELPDNVLYINDKATNTYEEAQQIFEIVESLEVASLLIVTNRFHSRRALATYQHIFRDTNIELYIVSPDDGIRADSWWHLDRAYQIRNEYMKMPYYWLVYGIWSG